MFFFPLWKQSSFSGTGVYRIHFKDISGFKDTLTLLKGVSKDINGSNVVLIDYTQNDNTKDYSIVLSVQNVPLNILSLALSLSLLKVEQVTEIEKEIPLIWILAGSAVIILLIFLIIKYRAK